MSLDLKVLLIVATFSTVSAFVAYWAGVGATERRHRARIEALLADNHFLTELFKADGTERVADVEARAHLRLVGGDR